MTLPAAVLFDCDGVIVDSETPVFGLMVADLASYGFTLTLADFDAQYIGRTIAQIGVRLRENGAEIPEDWDARFYDKLYAMLREGVDLFAGVTDVFDALDAAGIPFAIGSNGSVAKMDITLGPRGVLPRFRVVLSGEDMGRPKPLPDLYLAGAKACGADPAACVVIEDSPTGATAALRAGMRVFGFAPHGADTAPARGLVALGVPLFHDMADLPALLGLHAA